MSNYSVVSGIYIDWYGQIGFPYVALQVWCLESILVRSNRISVCRIPVWCLESLLVRSNRISVCRITGVVSGISIGTVK